MLIKVSMDVGLLWLLGILWFQNISGITLLEVFKSKSFSFRSRKRHLLKYKQKNSSMYRYL